MALVRLAIKNLQQRVLLSPSSSSSSLSHNVTARALNAAQKQQLWSSSSEILRRFTTAANEEKPEGAKEVTVTEGSKKSKLFPRRRRRSLWKNNREFIPSLRDIIPSGLGNALVQATENISRLVESLPSKVLIGRVKEQDECYKLRFEVPGLGKDDVKITVADGTLSIKGEHKEEEEEGSDDEFWSSKIYGYYDTSLVLPDDAKVDEIKAELKDGVLSITIPKTEKPKKDVKEIPVH